MGIAWVGAGGGCVPELPRAGRFGRELAELTTDELRLRQLALVLAVAEAGSIQAAAAELHLGQPAVSRSVRALERRLGVELFERLPRGVRPTEAGEVVLAFARRFCGEYQALRRRLELQGSGDRPLVVVGNLLAGSADLIPAAVTRFRRDHPDTAVRIVEETPDILRELLVDHRVDLIVGRLHGGETDLDHEPLYDEEVCVVVRTGHPAIGPTAGLADLADADWILPPPETHLRDQLDREFGAAGVRRLERPVVECINISTIRTLVLGSDMVAALPRGVVARDLADGVMVALPVALPRTLSTIGITRRGGEPVRPPVEDFVTALRAAVPDAAE